MNVVAETEDQQANEKSSCAEFFFPAHHKIKYFSNKKIPQEAFEFFEMLYGFLCVRFWDALAGIDLNKSAIL